MCHPKKGGEYGYKNRRSTHLPESRMLEGASCENPGRVSRGFQRVREMANSRYWHGAKANRGRMRRHDHGGVQPARRSRHGRYARIHAGVRATQSGAGEDVKTKRLNGQLAFELFEQPKPRNPFDCPDARAVVDIGGGKTYCEPWQTWTNCLEAGHCVFAAWRDSQK